MSTAESEPTRDLTALQQLPETEPAPDDEGEDPTCATTGVHNVSPEAGAEAAPDNDDHQAGSEAPEERAA